MDGVVELGRGEGDAEGDQGVHLIVLLAHAVVLGRVALLEVLRPADVHEDVAEHADGVGVAPQHHVAETDVVVRGEVRRHDAREHGFLVQLDVVERLQREREVPQQAVHPQQPDDGEVAEHAVERPRAVLAGDQVGVFVALHREELLVDLRPLDQGVEHVEDRVAAPHVGVFAQDGGFAGFVFGDAVGGRAGDAVAVAAEGFKLVDEFVDYVPGPVILNGLKGFSQ